MRIRPSFIILTFISLLSIHLLYIPYARCEPPKDKLVLKGLYLGMEYKQALEILRNFGKDTKKKYCAVEILEKKNKSQLSLTLITYDKYLPDCRTAFLTFPKNSPNPNFAQAIASYSQKSMPLCFWNFKSIIDVSIKNNIVDLMSFDWRKAFGVEDATFEMFTKSFCDKFSLGTMNPNLDESNSSVSLYFTFISRTYHYGIELTEPLLIIKNIGNLKPKF
jgi:hypothetical protein